MINLLRIIYQIAILFGVFYIGNCIQRFFGLFIHGSVIGLILMFILLTTGIVNPRFIQDGFSYMLKHLVSFFIPTTVGVINFYHFFVGKGILLIVITIISSLLVMISAGYTSQFLARGKEQEQVNERKSTRLNSSHVSISYAVFC